MVTGTNLHVRYGNKKTELINGEILNMK